MLIKAKNNKCLIYNIFDSSLNWHKTDEGHKFWYLMQLDLTQLLLIYGPTNVIYAKYYSSLLKDYSHEGYKNDKVWKLHQEYYNNLEKISEVIIRV